MKVLCVDMLVCMVVGCNGVMIVVVIMIVVYFVGIFVFVIGGIGGVYKGVDQSFDIFVDFMEFV